MKNLYVYQINTDDGQQVLADSEKQAKAFIFKNYAEESDTVTIELMGQDYDENHWENEHIEVA